MTDREAMKLALDALDALYINDYSGYEISKHDAHIVDDAITALRQALEQPEQEPVAWVGEAESGYRDIDWDKEVLQRAYPSVTPLYTAPPKREWQGLTDEEGICDAWERITGHNIDFEPKSEGRAMYLSADEVIEFARAIEAKLKEKNI